MEDDELAKIRQRRLAQLEAQGGGEQSGNKVSGGPGTDKQKEQQRQAKEREAEMRNNILSAVLTQEARARLSTLAVAKPERASMVENIIIQNTRMGAIRGKVDEEALKGLLEKVNDQTKRETKVSYERRRVFDDDDDEEEDEDD